MMNNTLRFYTGNLASMQGEIDNNPYKTFKKGKEHVDELEMLKLLIKQKEAKIGNLN